MRTPTLRAKWFTLDQAAALIFPDRPASLARKSLFQAIDNHEIQLYVQLQSQQILSTSTDDEYHITSDTLMVHLSDDTRCDALHAWLRDAAKGLENTSASVPIPQVVYQERVFDLIKYDPRDDSVETEPPFFKVADLVVLETSLHQLTQKEQQPAVGKQETLRTIKVSEGPDDEKMLDIKAVTEMLGIGKSAWHAGIKAGIYPKPIKFGKASRWEKRDIRKLVAERKPGFRQYTK